MLLATTIASILVVICVVSTVVLHVMITKEDKMVAQSVNKE